VLNEPAMTAGLSAIQSLLADAAPFAPTRIVLVATSAVRDAANGAEFRANVFSVTGHQIRILSGDEEANLIGRGLTSDPALAGLRDFYVFDLGGGSLECLAFRARHIESAASLQLGCVRLTETFVHDETQPLAPAAHAAIERHTKTVVSESTFHFSLPPGATAIATGGTITVARAILAQRRNQAFESSAPEVTIAQLRELLAWVGGLPLAERKKIPGLPSARADVMPAALVTLIAVGDAGGFDRYRHSLYNLRYGLADEALG
jgi:exopolyphosphatase/guanosine-5'-triphosphate,3'-diphosphate pyrophosphatase